MPLTKKSSYKKIEKELNLSEAARKHFKEQLRLARKEIEKKAQERIEEIVKSNHALQEEITERKRMEKEALEIAQLEQKRFGSQLHDGLCQELMGILMLTKSLTQKTKKDHLLDLAELKKITDLLHEAINQARDTARG